MVSKIIVLEFTADDEQCENENLFFQTSKFGRLKMCCIHFLFPSTKSEVFTSYQLRPILLILAIYKM